MADKSQAASASKSDAKGGGSDSGLVTCPHCKNQQKPMEFFRFCEFCRKPLDATAAGPSDSDKVSFNSQKIAESVAHRSQQALNQSTKNSLTYNKGGVAGGALNATNMSWNSTKSKKKKQWAGPIASRPIGLVTHTVEKKALVKARQIVDWVILDEICEVVKFEAMNLIDKLLLVNSAPKMQQLEKVKKHKHVVFAETPTIFEYHVVRTDKKSKPKPSTNNSNTPDPQSINIPTPVQSQPPDQSTQGRTTVIEQRTEVFTTQNEELQEPKQKPVKEKKQPKMRLAAQPINLVEQKQDETVEVTMTVVKEEVKQEEPKEEASSSSSEEEEEVVEESVLGVCDFHNCQERTFMRCDYDMNDIIDPRSNKCQLVLTCRWKGIRGCERQFCHFHAGKLVHWPSRCCSQRNSIALLPCESCRYWVRYVKCKFWGLIFLFFLWAGLVAAIVYYSAQGVKGSYDFEYKINQF